MGEPEYVWVVEKTFDYEGSEIKGIYRNPHRAREEAVRLLLIDHCIDTPPPAQVDDLHLGEFSWRYSDTFTWSTRRHEVFA